MTTDRRARPTIRCLEDDLDLDLPDLNTDLGDVDHPLLDELRRIAPGSPSGQKRILSIDHPLMYRIRVSRYRGATWVDDRAVRGERRTIVWLCAAELRDEGSDDDAYVYFRHLHDDGRLVPDDDDLLRDQAEAAVRLFKELRAALFGFVDNVLAGERDVEQRSSLGDWLPCRLLLRKEGGVEEIWFALSARADDGTFVSEELRDLIFAELEDHLEPAVFETRSDWPTGEVQWFEIVRLGLR